jgi:hypothetical protein
LRTAVVHLRPTWIEHIEIGIGHHLVELDRDLRGWLRHGFAVLRRTRYDRRVGDGGVTEA